MKLRVTRFSVGLVMVTSAIVIALATWIFRDEMKPRGPAIRDADPNLDPIRLTSPEKESFERLSPEQLAYYHSTPDPSAKIRSLAIYYSRRAYAGAPPVVPHPTDISSHVPGQPCLSCHQSGGFVAKWKAYTPITPHPELKNCVQCHVPANTTGEFRPTAWAKTSVPPRGERAMPGAPPTVPHTLDMRQNCLSCHAGPSAPPEIRTTHPERSNCLQCHAPTNVDYLWKRP